LIKIEQSICNKCGLIIEDIETAFQNGCPNCASHLFSFTSTHNVSKKSNIAKLTNQNIAIEVLGKGIFSLNLNALTSRENNLEPVIIKDNKGVINLILNSED